MIVLYGSSTRYILYQHLNLGWRLANLPHIEQGEGVGNLPYIEQREGRTGRIVRAATMGRLGKRGAGYNISFDLFLKPRDVRLGSRKLFPWSVRVLAWVLCMKSWQSLPLREWHRGGFRVS